MTRALERTGRVRGPLFTIPDAIDVDRIASFNQADRDLDLLVIANKQPELGHRILGDLNGAGRAQIVDTRSPHDLVLGLMGRAAVTVLVPNPKEGFYLPALEGMALGTVVVCPDCIGNRSYCIDRDNCFRPAYEVDAIVSAAREALAHGDGLHDMLASAAATAQRHDLRHERSTFLEILDRVDELWASS